MIKAGIFLAEGFEEVEGLAVVDLLRRAGMEVEMLSVTGNALVEGSHGIGIRADKPAKEGDYDSYSILLLPGGLAGTANLENSAFVLEKLKKFAAEGKWLGAICAAPGVLGRAGLLKDREAVCYPGCEENLEGAKVCFDPVKIDGKIITSRGMGTAIDFGLAIVEQLISGQAARELARKIVYNGYQ